MNELDNLMSQTLNHIEDMRDRARDRWTRMMFRDGMSLPQSPEDQAYLDSLWEEPPIRRRGSPRPSR